MPKLETLCDGKVVLETRGDSNKIQIRIIHGPKDYERFSAGTHNIEKARLIAQEAFDKAEERVKSGKTARIEHGKFKRICNEYIKILEDKKEVGADIPSDANTISHIKRWIRPFFGELDILEIDEDTIYKFERHIEKELGRIPAKGTLNAYNGALRQLFELAARKKLRPRSEFPNLTIKNKGRKTVRRPDFEGDEIKPLLNFLATWHLQGDNFSTRYKRQLLFCYTGILLMTGIRTGKEPRSIRWADVREDYTDIYGNKGTVIYMPHRKIRDDGEIAKVIAYGPIGIYLNALRELTGYSKPDDYLFVMPDGNIVADLTEPFKSALNEAGMLRPSSSDRNRTLYSLRHTYATMMLRRQVPIEIVAANMDTSVAMIQRHYGHVRTELAMPSLTGKPAVKLDYEQELRDLIPDDHKNMFEQMLKVPNRLHNTTNLERLADFKKRKKKT